MVRFMPGGYGLTQRIRNGGGHQAEENRGNTPSRGLVSAAQNPVPAGLTAGTWDPVGLEWTSP